MDTYTIQLILGQLLDEISVFYHSSIFLFIKTLIGIYVAIVFIDLVLLLIQRGIGSNLRQMRHGMDIPSEFVTKKNKMKMRWEEIIRHLEGDNESEYKVAIIEADAMIDDLVKRMGYKGANLRERLTSIPAGQLDETEEMIAAHEIRNRIIYEKDFKVDRNFAKEVLKKYEHLLRHFEVLD